MQIRLVWVGRTKNPWIRELVRDYLERLNHFVRCETREVRDPVRASPRRGKDLASAGDVVLLRELSATEGWIALDEKGREFTSRDLADWIAAEQDRGTRALVFVLGGPDGLGPRVLEGARLKLGLGRMTWTHEMCRVLLLEQLYRAYCIMRNVPYHRD